MEDGNCPLCAVVSLFYFYCTDIDKRTAYYAMQTNAIMTSCTSIVFMRKLGFPMTWEIFSH